MNLHDLFAAACKRNPEQCALRFKAGPEAVEQTWTYAALFAEADAVAAFLHAQGLRQGQRVALCAHNSPQFVIAYLAVIRLGAIAVPINTRYRRAELTHILADSAPRLIVTERAFLPLLAEVISAGADAPACLLLEQMEAWRADAADVQLPWVDGDELALIMYTSGTTGPSKGAMLSHNAIMATVTALLAAWAWEPADRLLLVLPLFHVHGLIVGLHCALAAGASVLLRMQYDAQATPLELVAGAATCFFAVPTIYVRLVAALAALTPAQRAPLAAMRLFCSGSAPLAPTTFAAFRALTGHAILERYGMTETGMNLSNPYAGARVAGSVGLPLPGVSARIVGAAEDSQSLAEVDAGAAGELLIAGANLFAGYWHAPEKSAAAFVTDADARRWFRTGDLARRDAVSGYITLLGRSHDLIISGGFNIYPREIEEVLLRYPGIREAAVVGVADAEWGERPEAWLVCDAALGEDELAALATWCRAELASFKTPRAFHQINALPRNAMGKVQKNELPHDKYIDAEAQARNEQQ